MTPLRQRMAEDMAVRNLSPCTQSSYIQQVSQFARHFGRSPALLGPEQIRDYQVFLATEKKLAPSSIGIAVSALRFLYRVTLRKPWPIFVTPIYKSFMISKLSVRNLASGTTFGEFLR